MSNSTYSQSPWYFLLLALGLFVPSCSDGGSGDGTGQTQPGDGDGDGDGTGDGDGDGDGTGDGDGDGDGGTETGPYYDVGSPDVPEPPSDGIPETCDEAAAGDSTVGCEFYAADLDLVVVYDQNQYAVAVANVQLEQSATVTVEADEGNGYEVVAGPEEIDALDLFTFELPDRHIDRSGVRYGGAYRITSDVPIVAYQFEPLEAGESFTSDAALLYPTPAWDTLHYVLNQHKINSAQESYFTVLASEDGTEVTVTPSVDTVAGTGVPAGLAGEAFMVPLDDGDMLQVAIAYEDDDPTGTRVESNTDHPIAVFSGNTCALIPDESGACDHLQDQMFGVRLWGTEFVASRMPVRSNQGTNAEPSLWQLFANEEDTEVSFEGAALLEGLPLSPQSMQPGDVLSFMVEGPFSDPGDFLISSSKPIAVANYMTGSTTVNSDSNSTGDPSQVQLAPIEQFLPRYVVLVPDTWEFDVATITRHVGSEVSVDGGLVPDDEFVAVGAEFEIARVPLADGVHVLEGNQPFSIVIVGYDDDDSYAYLGGAGTSVINPNPEG
jgi:hypothetical protein